MTSGEATINSIAPWFGGKRTLAPVIIGELGPHSAYWEPFCGSCAVLLAKAESSHETVNDLHRDLVNLATVLISPRWADLYGRLGRWIMTEDGYAEARERISNPPADVVTDPAVVGESHVDRAFWYFIASWAGRNGTSGTRGYNYQMAVRWTPGGGAGGQRFASATDSIPAWHRRLRRVTVLNRDAFDVLAAIQDDPGVAVYVDPPYLKATRTGSLYLHDLDECQHADLAEALTRFHHARVVVSYYDHPKLDDLYPDWTKRPVYRMKNLHVQNRRGLTKTTAPEVLLINGPSYARAADDATPLFGPSTFNLDPSTEDTP